MKNILYIVLFLSISTSAFSDIAWKCVDQEMNGFKGHWTDFDACYNPVEDSIYKLTVRYPDDDHVMIHKYNNKQWLSKILNYSTDYKYNRRNILDEENNAIIPLWIVYGGDDILEMYDFEIRKRIVANKSIVYPGYREVQYAAINLSPGQFLVTYNPMESMYGSSYPACSSASSWTGTKTPAWTSRT